MYGIWKLFFCKVEFINLYIRFNWGSFKNFIIFLVNWWGLGISVLRGFQVILMLVIVEYEDQVRIVQICINSMYILRIIDVFYSCLQVFVKIKIILFYLLLKIKEVRFNLEYII